MSESIEPQHSEASPQHTPGPWRVVSSVYVDDVYGPDGDMLASVLSPADPDVTADMNAVLIAAAPDLLAAAKVVAYEFLSGMEYPEAQALRDAIAKAEGRDAE